MQYSHSESSLRHFYTQIYNLLRETDTNILEMWCEISDIPFCADFSTTKLTDFLENLPFISIKKGNYRQYLVVDKILFILDCIKILKYDIKDLSKILNYSGFEKLIKSILNENNFLAITNFRFSGPNLNTNTTQKKFEIDVIGIYLNNILIIDAKQWNRKDSYSTLNKAANLQYSRIKALKQNKIAFSRLLIEILGENADLKKRLPFNLIPMMVTLEDNSIKLNENHVPLVSIYELNAYLQELPKNMQLFKLVKVSKLNIQKKIEKY
ncbi:MAG: NERD domain-containing protein [Promethearchaeota archaeon]|jgi:hypothetical protein